MYFNNHNPPHFHARYNDQKISIEIETLKILEGSIPPRALGMVMEWASVHKEELMEDWNLAKSNRPPKKIEPLQ